MNLQDPSPLWYLIELFSAPDREVVLLGSQVKFRLRSGELDEVTLGRLVGDECWKPVGQVIKSLRLGKKASVKQIGMLDEMGIPTWEGITHREVKYYLSLSLNLRPPTKKQLNHLRNDLHYTGLIPANAKDTSELIEKLHDDPKTHLHSLYDCKLIEGPNWLIRPAHHYLSKLEYDKFQYESWFVEMEKMASVLNVDLPTREHFPFKS